MIFKDYDKNTVFRYCQISIEAKGNPFVFLLSFC